jgi:hypothetical protein
LALLALARGEVGIDGAYRCLTEPEMLEAALRRALIARDPGQLEACGAIEIHIYGWAFHGIFHMALAWMLARPAHELSGDFLSQLIVATEHSDTDALERAKEQLADLLPGISPDSVAASQLQDILGLGTGPRTGRRPGC